MRLKRIEVKEFRKKLLAEQKGICPLCMTTIKSGEDTLDHDHGTGHVRRVLCRNCNQIEGRVLSWLRRSYTTPLEFLRRLTQYWDTDYRNNPYHPNHRSEIEKEISKLRKRMRRLKRERTKQKYRDRIKELKERA